VYEDFVFILEELQRFMGNGDIELVGVVAQNIWLRRNSVVHGKSTSPHNKVVSNAFISLMAFKNANSQKIWGIIAEKRELCWKALLNGFVKINWDAAVNKTKKKMGIGVIIRDCKGDVRATLAEPKDYIIAPDVAEAMAALRSEKFSCELGYS
jgi:hypothetical protein